MNFFRRMGNALARFMYGRNGIDQLSIAMVWACIFLEIISAVISRPWPSVGAVVYYVSLALWVLVMFRTFSKNLGRRREENSQWLTLWRRITSSGSGARARHADKEHKYFTCKSCGAICRVPVGKGKIIITCPKCGAEIKAKT